MGDMGPETLHPRLHERRQHHASRWARFGTIDGDWGLAASGTFPQKPTVGLGLRGPRRPETAERVAVGRCAHVRKGPDLMGNECCMFSRFSLMTQAVVPSWVWSDGVVCWFHSFSNIRDEPPVSTSAW